MTILSIVMAVGSFYIARTDEVIQTVTSGRAYDIRTYDLVVLGEDAAQTVKDTRDYTFAVQPSFRQDDLASIINGIKEDVGGEISIVEMSSSLAQADALLAGEVGAIVYRDDFTSMIVEKYPDYESKIRILGQYTVKTESAVQTVDVDVNSHPFLIYISGTDSEGSISLTGRSDVNIVAGINTDSHEILLLSIPRDYYVEFPGITTPGSRDKLTHSGIYGLEELLATVENLIGYKINYYVRVNFSSMTQIVDAIGGVTIYNPMSFVSNGGYDFPEGTLNLDGEHALHYVRERFAFQDGDFERGRNQIKVIRAMLDKILSVNTLANYNKLADAISNFAATNIPAQDITDIIKLQLSDNPEWHVVSYQLLGDVMFQPCQSGNGAYLSVDMPYKESVENAHKLLKQLVDGEILSEDLQLEDDGQLTYIASPVK